MKKKFIFLAMLLLTVLGGVNLNVLNAQEDVVTINGDATSYSNICPISFNYNYSLSQHTYTASEINHAAGVVDKIAFKVNVTQTRNLTLYLQNTTIDALSSWVSFTDEDKVYSNSSVNTAPSDGWLIIDVDDFYYDGTNILLTSVDNTGSSVYTWNAGSAFLGNAGRNATLYLYDNNNPISVTSSTAYPSTRQPALKLYFAEQTDDIIPAAPTNLVATTNNHKSVSLTWEAGENAKKYNVHVYNNGAEIAGSPYTTDETAYTVEGLEAETTYTFKVQSVLGSNLSEDFSNEASATTLPKPKTQTLWFTLNDSFGDGWNGGTLSVTATDGTDKILNLENGRTASYVLDIAEGADVTVKFNAGSYASECSYDIYYEDGEAVTTNQSGLFEGHIFLFTVKVSGPKVTVEALDYDIYSDEQTTLTATAANFEGDVTYSWSSNGEIVGNESTYTFAPSAAGTYTFTCTATDANNNEASADVTIYVTERPALALNVTADKAEIYQGQSTMLYATATGGFSPYTFSWTLNGQEVATTETYNFSSTEVGTYNITCKVTDANNTTIEESVTVNVAEGVTIMPDKLYRIKALSYNTKDAYDNYDGPFSFSNDMYLHITSYSASDEPLVWVLPYEETSAQMFTFESTGTEDVYRLRSADGYYIRGYQWNVSSTQYQYYASQIRLNFIDGVEFYLMNGNKYYKAEYGDGGNYKVYCDFEQQYMTATWVLEEVPLFATAYASKEMIYDDETITLGVNVMSGSGNYTYSWSPIEGLDDPTSANPAFTPSASGEYTFTCTVTDTESNTTTEASVKVNAYERPNLKLTVSADKNLIYNDGETAVLTATVTDGYAPYTYSWTLDGEEVGTEATYSFSNTTVGEYTLTCTVTDARGNTQTASTTIEVKDVCEKPLEIVLGTPINATTYYPTSPLYGNSYSQQIYTASEINMSACEITSISFMKFNNTALSRNIKVFMLNVNKDSFTSNSDWVSVSDSDVVFDGSFDFAGNKGDWTTIELTNKFSYTGGDILLCVNDHTNDWRQDYPQFYAYSVDAYRSIMIRRDDTPYPDVMSGQAYAYEKNVNHIKFGYELPAPKPESLVANPAQLYPNETTTLTWNEFEGAASYNIYVNGSLEDNTTELTYELSGLTYNVEPGYTIEVAAVYEDATESGKASVTVQVAGTFTLTVNVKDGEGNPIEGATVSVTTDEWTYDEFGNNIASLADVLTDENGQAVFNNVKLLNTNGYCAYSVSATMGVYGTHTTTPITNYEGVVNGDNVTREIVMTLSEPQNVTADKDLYVEGEDVVLTWEAPEFNTRAFLGYNVYSVVGGDYELGTETAYTQLNEETLTETTYTIENVEYGAKFAVSAVYNEGESSKVNANVQITAYATLTVIVKDANTYEGVNGAVVEVQSYRTGGIDTYITSEAGIVEEALLLGYYTVTVKKNDSHYEVVPQDVELVHNGAEIEFLLTPKASIENVTVTADNNGNVSWTGSYEKYNVYRRNVETPQELTSVATGVTTTSTTDTEWEMLELGTYQYGVSTFVEPQAQTRGTEVIFEEGFENGFPAGWDHYDVSSSSVVKWYVTNAHNGIPSKDGSYIHTYSQSANAYATLKTVEYTVPKDAMLIFDYYSKPWGQDKDDIEVYVFDENNISYKLHTTNTYNEWKTVELSLSQFEGQSIQIWFKSILRWGYGVALDNFKITGADSSVETQIVWSNEVVKQGPNTFEGTVSDAWNVAENWSNGAVPAIGDEAIVNAGAVITGDVNVSKLTINASLTVADGGVLTVTGKISQASDYLLVLEEGGQIFQNNSNVTARFRMSIDNPTDWSAENNKDGWQFISMPLENVPYTDFISYGEYDLYKYDGNQDLEWQNHKDGGFDYGGVPETTFRLGHGYLASLKDVETATVDGTLNVSTPTVFGGYTQIIYNEEKDLANFRLFGNPFTYDIYMNDFVLDFYNDGENDFVNGYAVVDEFGAYDYRTTEPIKVGEGFFVKAITSTAMKYAPANTRSENKSNNSLNITATGKAGKDNVVINLAGKSEGFDKLQNFNDEISTVYVAEAGVRYGIYNCDADVKEVELNFEAVTMGNYTIAAQPNGEFEMVTLVDKFTGIETNLLLEDYTFTATSKDANNRFIVRLAKDSEHNAQGQFVYQSGEELIINAQGMIQIVDVLGRVVYQSEHHNDINRVGVENFDDAAYVVRCVNGNEVKTQKIVIL